MKESTTQEFKKACQKHYVELSRARKALQKERRETNLSWNDLFDHLIKNNKGEQHGI